uniref:AN1-type domain-containing protein n=1 Tax=Bracon brevicornis TaxID=1563983 RepID=A0A6V7IIZ4_9HYME
MEFHDLGSRCTITSCNLDDFLPFTCIHCSQIYCKNHFSPLAHECKQNPDNIVTDTKKSTSFICSDDSCSTSSPVEMNCVECKRHFCLTHRWHGCLEVSQEKVDKFVEASEKTRKEFETAKTTIDALVQENLKKSKKTQMANKVQLMRLKGRATGSKAIPTDERRYFLVHPPLNHPKTAMPFFVSSRWTVGKVMDVICDSMNIGAKHNNEELRVFHQTSGKLVICKMDTPIADLFDSGELTDGQSLIFEYSNQSHVDASLYK